MKQLVLIVIASLCAISLNAQWKVGPKVSTGSIAQKAQSFRILPNSEHGIYDLDYVGSSAVHSAGLMAYRDLGPFFLQTEIMATKYSLKFQMDTYKSLNATSPVYSENHYMVEVPFIAGINPKNFKIGLGPVVEFRVDKDSQFEAMDYYIDQSKKMEFGFQGMIGYNLGVLHIDLKYVNKFNSIADSFNFGDDEMKLNKSANRLMIAVGVAF